MLSISFTKFEIKQKHIGPIEKQIFYPQSHKKTKKMRLININFACEFSFDSIK